MNKFADKIILKNIDINNIISKYDNQLTILELFSIINYDTKNIYINKFFVINFKKMKDIFMPL